MSYVDEPGLCERPLTEEAFYDDDCEVLPEDVPTGDSKEDRRRRQEIIKLFYFNWKKRNPELCKFNYDLGENVYIIYQRWLSFSWMPFFRMQGCCLWINQSWEISISQSSRRCWGCSIRVLELEPSA